MYHDTIACASPPNPFILSYLLRIICEFNIEIPVGVQWSRIEFQTKLPKITIDNSRDVSFQVIWILVTPINRSISVVNQFCVHYLVCFYSSYLYVSVFFSHTKSLFRLKAKNQYTVEYSVEFCLYILNMSNKHKHFHTSMDSIYRHLVSCHRSDAINGKANKNIAILVFVYFIFFLRTIFGIHWTLQQHQQ